MEVVEQLLHLINYWSLSEEKQEAVIFVTRTVHDVPVTLQFLTDTTSLEEKQVMNYGEILTL
jgi:hypothetical protein